MSPDASVLLKDTVSWQENVQLLTGEGIRMDNRWNDTGRGSFKYSVGDGTVSIPINPPQIPRGLN